MKNKKNHTFRKHPSKHSNKAVRNAFKCGVKTGINIEKNKEIRRY